MLGQGWASLCPLARTSSDTKRLHFTFRLSGPRSPDHAGKWEGRGLWLVGKGPPQGKCRVPGAPSGRPAGPSGHGVGGAAQTPSWLVWTEGVSLPSSSGASSSAPAAWPPGAPGAGRAAAHEEVDDGVGALLRVADRHTGRCTGAPLGPPVQPAEEEPAEAPGQGADREHQPEAGRTAHSRVGRRRPGGPLPLPAPHGAGHGRPGVKTPGMRTPSTASTEKHRFPSGRQCRRRRGRSAVRHQGQCPERGHSTPGRTGHAREDRCGHWGHRGQSGRRTETQAAR